MGYQIINTCIRKFVENSANTWKSNRIHGFSLPNFVKSSLHVQCPYDHQIATLYDAQLCFDLRFYL